jgi:hypothetical protein
MSKQHKRFTNFTQQSRMVEGVCVPIFDGGDADFDELLRESIRVALRTDLNPTDDWDELYDRIKVLLGAYVRLEGEGEDTVTLMARLAACVADVIPMAVRKGLCR